MSSGNQRKLCILISLLGNPDIFVYDEATCGVDLIMKLKLKNLFENFKEKNNSIGLFTTHFLKDIDIFCDKLLLIKNGKIIFSHFIDQMKEFLGGYVIKFIYSEE